MADEERHRTKGTNVPEEVPTSSRGFVRFNQSKKKSWHLFALCAVILVPLVYVALFLFSLQDPYGGMNQVPAVVVNLDRGAEIDGEQRNIGQELSDSLIEDNSLAVDGEVSGFDWNFTTSERRAAQSLRDGAYYMEIVIPEDFSQAIASACTKDATKAELKVYYNPAASFGAQTVGKGLITRIVDKLKERVQGDYLNSIFLTIKEAGSDLLTVANAGLDLTDGLFTARDGSAELADGVQQLAEGNATLTNGLYEAGDGASQLADGAGQLASGVMQLADGLGQLKQGIESSSSSAETVALANALSEVGYYLQAFGVEATKENPDTALEQAYLESAAAAASAAADANSTIGDPLVAYISGGSFSYASGSTTVTCTEQGLIPALAAYVQAENELVAFEQNELAPLLALLEELGDSIEDMEGSADTIKADIEALYAATENYAQCVSLYREALNAYSQALEDFAAGTITEEELAAYKAAVDTAAANVTAARDSIAAARQKLADDLPDFIRMISIIAELWEQIGSVEHIEELINELMTLIENEARAGAAVQGAAGKVEGYLVGVAVTSSYASGSTSKLADAINQIYVAVAVGSGDSTSLVEGTSQLATGATSLAEGIYTAADGSNTITLNLATVASGSQSLAEGINTAASTSGTLFEGLLSGVDSQDEQAANSEVRSEVISDPITVNGEASDGESITSVANYGTSIAPYYLGLGLWLGCLLATLVLRPINEKRFRTSDSTPRLVLAGYLPLAGIAIVQVVSALAIVQFGLRMNVSFPVAYYLFGVLVALVFAALNQMLVGSFGIGGLFVSVVLLAAQLCMASGTFPIESAFSAMGIISMLMPMTYVVRGLRVAMCGLGVEYVAVPSVVLAVVGLTALVLTVVFVTIRRRRARKKGDDGMPGSNGDAPRLIDMAPVGERDMAPVGERDVAPVGERDGDKYDNVECSSAEHDGMLVASAPVKGVVGLTRERVEEAALCDEDDIDLEEALDVPVVVVPVRVPEV